MEYEKCVQETIRELVRDGAVESAHDISDGGLAVAIAECSFGDQNVGARIIIDSKLAPELLLFHEGPSRIVVSTTNPQKVFDLARAKGVQAVEIGVTLEARVTIRNRDRILIDAGVCELKNAWGNALENLLRNPVWVPDA